MSKASQPSLKFAWQPDVGINIVIFIVVSYMSQPFRIFEFCAISRAHNVPSLYAAVQTSIDWSSTIGHVQSLSCATSLAIDDTRIVVCVVIDQGFHPFIYTRLTGISVRQLSRMQYDI